MKETYLLSKDEKQELESIANIILSITDSFEMFTADKFDDEENDSQVTSISELRDRMKYDMIQLENAQTVIINILNGTYDGTTSVKNYELSQ